MDSTAAVDVHTRTDGTVVVQLHGVIDIDSTVQLHQTLVHLVRRIRPLRLVIELGSVSALDPLHCGAIAALTDLADDHHVAIFIENPPPAAEAGLLAAGIDRHRIRQPAKV